MVFVHVFFHTYVKSRGIWAGNWLVMYTINLDAWWNDQLFCHLWLLGSAFQFVNQIAKHWCKAYIIYIYIYTHIYIYIRISVCVCVCVCVDNRGYSRIFRISICVYVYIITYIYIYIYIYDPGPRSRSPPPMVWSPTPWHFGCKTSYFHGICTSLDGEPHISMVCTAKTLVWNGDHNLA